MIDRECTNCELHHSRQRTVPGHGSKKAQIAIVLEAPGEEEDNLGLPTIGTAGNQLHNALVETGLSRSFWISGSQFNRYHEDEWPFQKYTKYGEAYLIFKPENVFITNTVICRPPSNRTPTLTEIKACSERLEFELSQLPNLTVIIPCGAVALEALTGYSKIMEYRGYPLFDYKHRLCVPTLHPSFLLHGQQIYYQVLISDLKKAKRYAEKGGWSEPKTSYKEGRNCTIDGIISQLASGYSLDIETRGADEESGLDPRLGEITGLAVSSSIGTAFHFSFDNAAERSQVSRLLEALPNNIAFQNGPFDTAFLSYKGYPCKCVFDTRIAQALLSPGLPKSLRFLNSVNTDYPYYKGMRKDLLKGKLDHSDTVKYCCMDADTTQQNREILTKELKEEGLWEIFNNIVMPLSQIFPKIQLKGVRVDVEAIKKHLDETDPESIQAKATKIEDMFWAYNINIRSPQQMSELLYDKLKLPSTKKTRNTQQKTLERLYETTGNAIVAAKLDYSNLHTQLKLFQGLLKRTMGTDRVHTKYDAVGTETGRPASTDPNLNNITLERRDIFLPDEGYTFIQGDYSRLELRVIAALSNDEAFIRDVWEREIHKEVASSLFGDHYNDAEYLRGKTVTFGIIYGRSARSIARAFGITVVTAEGYINKIAGKYKRLMQWCEEMKQQARNNGFVRTPFGRIRHLMDGNIDSMAVNTPVQSGGADVCNSSLIKLWNDHNFDVDSNGPQMLMTVYDSIIVQTPHNQVEATRQTMKEVMERPIPELNNFSFPVDFKQSSVNWREIK